MRLRHGTSNTRVSQPLTSILFPVSSLRKLFFFTAFFREMIIHIYTPNSSSAISHTSWRSQRVVVRSLAYSEPPLSITNIPTGLPNFPFRGPPSSFIPRHASLVFHPTEMLYAVGGPDGTGKSTFFQPLLVFLITSTQTWKQNSTNHGMQSSLNLFASDNSLFLNTAPDLFTNECNCHGGRKLDAIH
jgi:hypothetical protein